MGKLIEACKLICERELAGARSAAVSGDTQVKTISGPEHEGPSPPKQWGKPQYGHSSGRVLPISNTNMRKDRIKELKKQIADTRFYMGQAARAMKGYFPHPGHEKEITRLAMELVVLLDELNKLEKNK